MMFRFTKNGAIRFLRVGRVQVSWCICKPDAKAERRLGHPGTLAIDGLIVSFIIPVILTAFGIV